MKKIFSFLTLLLIIMFANAQGSWSYEDINSQSINKSLKDVVYDHSGNLILTGGFTAPTLTFGAINLSGNAGAVYVVKRVNGVYVWGKTFKPVTGYPFNLSIETMVVDASDNILLTGALQGKAAFDNLIATSLKNGTEYSQNIVTVKMSSTGTVLWVNVEGTKHDDICAIGISEYGKGITSDALGNVYTSGQQVQKTVARTGACNWVCNRTGTSTGIPCMYLVKYGPDGSKKWEKKFINPQATGNSCAKGTSGMCLESDGNNVYLLGHYYGALTIGNTTLTTGSEDIYNTILVKFDGNGNAVWIRPVTNSTNHVFGVGDDMMIDLPNNAIYFAGIFNQQAINFGSCSATTNGQHAFLGKVSLSGDCGWLIQPGGITIGMVKYPNNNVGALIRTGTSVGQDTFAIKEFSATDGSVLNSTTSQFSPNGYLNGYFNIAQSPNGFVLPQNLIGNYQLDGVTISSTQPLGSPNSDLILVNYTFVAPIAHRSELPIESGNFALYPNPATNQLTIRINNNKMPGTISIYDISGKMIWKNFISTPQTTINIQNLTRGVYCLRTDQGQATIKFIKN